MTSKLTSRAFILSKEFHSNPLETRDSRTYLDVKRLNIEGDRT